ncbi:MAG: ECF transporter S component [Lachnospiraceae bacterium]|nr:ECF transporter S component [Lachnospiraceae bacterium]
MNKTKMNHLTLAALFGALAFVLMYFSFSIPILSPFAELDLSAVPELIGGFMLGPVGGVEIITVKILLKLVFKGSSSMLTGEIQNFLLETAFVLPAAIYYQRNKTKKRAVVGLIIGSIVTIIVSIFTNIYLIFPVYIKLYGMDWNSILQIFAEINPWIKNIPTMIAFSIVPFNIVSRTITSVITMLIYKKISILIKGSFH